MPRHDERRPSARLAEIALLVALACVLGYVERAILVTSWIPGVRLGLANLAVVVALYRLGLRGAGLVALGKVLIIGVAFGTLLSPVGLMSAAGSAAAWLGMALLVRATGRFSVVGVSLGGSAAHVTGQLAGAAVLAASISTMNLLPLMLVASLPTGIAIGLVAHKILSHVSHPVLLVAEG